MARRDYRDPVYNAWRNMRRRCLSEGHPQYPNYGGRGITICPEWVVFETFRDDMGPRPEGMTLERRDNAKGYSPDNCVWATQQNQNRNKRANRMLTMDGVTLCLADWCEKYSVPVRMVIHRLAMGLDLHTALTWPKHQGIEHAFFAGLRSQLSTGI